MKIQHFVAFVTCCVFFFACKHSPYKVTQISGENTTLSDSLPMVDSLDAFVAPYRLHLNKSLDSVLCYTPTALSKWDGTYESSLGNLLADLTIKEGDPIFYRRTGKHIDFCLLNHGGIRAPLPKGAVRIRDAYRVMPFENIIVVVEMKGGRVLELLNYVGKSKRANPVSGLQIQFNEDGSLSKATVRGEPFDISQNYYVATIDYLQQGGGGMTFFADPVNLYSLDYKLRNAMIDHLAKKDTLTGVKDGRFKKLKAS